MKIKDVIIRKPLCIGPDTTLMKAALGMKVLGVGMLPVCENDLLVGTVTDRDITIRGTAEGCDPKTATVREVMSSATVFCFEDQEVEAAAELMGKHLVRRLPVLDQENRLAGVISLGDLAVRTEENMMASRVLARLCEPVGCGL